MTISIQIASLSTGSFQDGTYQVGPVTIASAFASVQVNSLTFSGAGFQSQAGPVGSVGCLIAPPSANLIQLTLKGVTGDTGIPIGAGNPSLVTFFNPTVSNTIGLTAAGAITGVVTLTFF